MSAADAVFAVPGKDSIIDTIRADGRSTINGHTLAEIRERYPTAVRMAWEDWRAEAAARQQTPIRWTRVSERRYQAMLEILPPLEWDAYGFLVGEAHDHDYATGQPRFAAFRERRGSGTYPPVYETASRPLTVAEFRTLKGQRHGSE